MVISSSGLNSLQLGEKISSIQLGNVQARRSIGNQYSLYLHLMNRSNQRRMNSV